MWVGIDYRKRSLKDRLELLVAGIVALIIVCIIGAYITIGDWWDKWKNWP